MSKVYNINLKAYAMTMSLFVCFNTCINCVIVCVLHYLYKLCDCANIFIQFHCYVSATYTSVFDDIAVILPPLPALGIEEQCIATDNFTTPTSLHHEFPPDETY